MEFTHEKFGKLRVVMKDGTPWFVACDVAKSLGIRNTNVALTKVSIDNKAYVYVDVPNGTPRLVGINEDGLRTMVFRSNKPGRVEYAAWIRNEVLPKVAVERRPLQLTGTTECNAIVVTKGVTKRDTPDNDRLQRIEENGLEIFRCEEFGQVRVTRINGEPWFVAADVCRALGLDQPTNAIRRLDDDEKALISIKGIHSGDAMVNIINECGLYSMILGSRKPEAKAFKRWITHDVIPAIHKHGGYVTPVTAQKLADDPLELVRFAVKIIEDQRDKLAEQNQQMDVLRAQIAKKRFIDDHHEDLTRFINKCVRSYGSSIYGKSNIALGWLDFYRNLTTELGEDVRKRGTPGIHFIEDYEMPMALRVAKNLVLDNYVNLFDIDTIDLIEGVVA